MIKSIVLRIYPNKTQLKIINDTLGACSFVKNKFLEYNKNNRKKGKEGKKFITAYDFSKIINKLKKEDDKYLWLDGISSKAIQEAILCKEKAYKAFFKKNKGFPKFRPRRKLNKESYYFINEQRNYYITKNSIKLPKLKKVRITNGHQLPDEASIRSGRIIRRYNKYYVKFIYDEYNDNKDIIKRDIKLGIDLGIKDYAVIYDGSEFYHYTHFKDYNNYKKLDEKNVKLQKIISKKAEYNYGKLLNEYLDKYHKEPSETKKNEMRGKAYNSSKIRRIFKKINAINIKMANIKYEFIKQLVNKLTARIKPKKINIEDLNISNMIGNGNTSHKLHMLAQKSNFYKFRVYLTSKCKEYGIKLRLINTYYPSTQICSNCGKKNNLKLEDRTFVCKKCGMTMDRDENAAINIYNCKYYKVIA